MRLLVTGGAGFIGSNFIRSWLRGNVSGLVVNLDLETYDGERRNLADVERDHGTRYLFMHGDIADGPLVTELFESHRPDAIVNVVAESHNSRAVIDHCRNPRTSRSGATRGRDPFSSHLHVRGVRRSLTTATISDP